MIPIYMLSVDGIDVSPRFRSRLNSLSLTEKRGDDADQLEIQLDDGDGALAFPRKGAKIALALGFDDGLGMIDKGQFTVDEFTWGGAPDVLTIRARAADFTSGLATRRDGSWRDTTLGAVVSQIAGRNQLEARIAPALAAIALPLVAQSRESDLALLRRLGREHDAVATIKAGRLVFARVGAGATAGGQALPSTIITRASGDSYSWSSADRDSDQATSSGSGSTARSRGVRARWRSVAGATTHTVLAGPAEGARRLPRIYASEDAATRAAQAAYDRRARKKAEFSITVAIGRPDVYPEQRITLQGFKAPIDAATWLVDEARHELGDSGLTTALKLQTAP